MDNNTDSRSNWWQAPVAVPDSAIAESALKRQASLTKPPGALGKLEEIAVRFAAWQGQVCPEMERVSICVFAADHGIVKDGVSAFPQEVTAEMVRNFARGGAAINVLARKLGANLSVVNLGTCAEVESLPDVLNARITSGTCNFVESPAMTSEQLAQALQLGAAQVNAQEQLVIGGEMGIGNTSSAAACAAALLGAAAKDTVGRGTGVDDETLRRKIQLIEQALQKHEAHLGDALQVLQHLGGLEIAGLVGYYIRAAQFGVPCLVDGYISSVAALIACRMNAGVREWLLFSHRSAEPGHQYVLDELNAQPLLDLHMRLGEGSGAAVAADLIHSALLLHRDMATFAEAAVSGAS